MTSDMDLESLQQTLRDLPEEYEPLLLSFPRDSLSVHGGTVVIGSDGGTDISVDVTDGCVRSIDRAGALPTRFVNGSVEKLAKCVRVYERYGKELRAAHDESAAQALVQSLRDNLATEDSEALANPENWWSVVVEQAQDGLL